jgi:acylphosphatase
MEKLYCRIYGRVQHVMFRDFATRKARKCHIVGYVHNRPDGSVEVYGEGSRTDLDRWLEYLHRGPMLAHVERVDAQWNEAPPSDMTQKSFDSFEIVF